MGRLERVTIEDLQEQLGRTEGNIPTQRVLAAIAWKQGTTLETLAKRHDVSEKTIRNWLDRFDQKPLARAPYDEDRPGRPSKLTGKRKKQFVADLEKAPTAIGYEQSEWYPELVQRHLTTNYGIEYSIRQIYRLMDTVDSRS